MSQSLSVVVSTFAAGVVAVATVLIARPQPSAPLDAGAHSMAVQTRLDELLERLERLEQRVATTGSAAVRTVADAPSRQDVERWIEAALAGRSNGGAASESAADGFAVDAAVAQLTDGTLGEEETAALWARAKQAGKVEDLIAAFERRAEGNPRSADAQADLGDAYVQAIINAEDMLSQSIYGQKADQAYDAALALDETHWHARFSKATGLTFWPDFLGKKAEAIANFEILAKQQEAATPRPEFVDTWLVLGNLYQQQGKDDEARKVWERGARQFPGDERLRARLGR